MKAITPNNLAPQNVGPGKDDNNLYLVAMLMTAILLFVVAYYDQVLGGLIR